MINIEELIKKYIRLVSENEGVDFLNYKPDYMTEFEFAKLKQLSEESNDIR